MGKELRESTGNCAATVMATGDRSRPQGIHSRGKSIFFKSIFKIVTLNPCSKSYDFWFYELMRRMYLFPYLLQYLKSTLIKQPCDRLLAACADRQLLHEGQLTLIGSYNSYVNRSKISKFYRCGSQCQQVQSYTYVGYNKFKIDTNLSSFHTIKVYASV